MSKESARRQLVWAIVQRHPGSVVALAEAAGVPLPEHDQVTAAPDSHPVRDGDPVHTDATVHAYHGGGVRGADAGGHLFLLSDRASTAARFRAEDAGRRAELAFAASFHSGRDLEPLEDVGQSLVARALSAALADFRANPPRTRAMLNELDDSDPTLADLYLRAIVEEVPMAMLGDILQPDMFDKLRHLAGFREYEAKVKAEGKAEAEAATTANNLTEFLILRGDKPTEHALHTIGACRDADLLAGWLRRAYLGETSAQLFPEPKPSAS